ncbi:ras-related and estrogen-regulated growth inhibitor-like protein [Salvelinus fontinalis]|uniref:ras-related and estrogen-regulated growth inhibitor-like protein n=1 Tax=Salvelinus fontinalis TaxID=8038 RepID=UPI0024868652|nr:ras-related and estrogen-regulated growth inhibitor-like protein [Salvelinus fontinalis]
MVVQVNQPTRHYSKTMEGSQQKVEANVLLVGAESVGKSALTVRFLTRRFIGEYGDIESIYSHTDRIEGREISFNIWDSLCSQNGEVEGHISDRQLQWADGFILVYSICDRASFNVVRQQVQRIQQAKSKFPGAHPVVIVGNKRDLQHRRTVSSEEGRLLALSTDCGFFEISVAETYHEVQLVFHELLDLIREARALKKGAAGIKGIVRSMSAVFGRKRTE